MREIGVRELKASLSEVLRSVHHEGRVRVTLRGRPVADIVPPQPEPTSVRDQMIAEGLLTPATKPLSKRPPKRVKPRGGMTASEAIIADRESER